MRKPQTPEQKEAKRLYDKARQDLFRSMKNPKVLRSKYRFVNDGNNKGITAHKVLVERVIGHPLPKAAEIHHIDNNGHNNSHDNLVVCPDSAYHMLLHRRQKALDACGNAGWYKCVFCKEYDDPVNLHLYIPKDQTSPRANHSWCAAEYSRKKKGGLHGHRIV